MKIKFFTVVTILAATVAMTLNATAQKGSKSAGSSKGRFDEMIKAARDGKAATNPEIAKEIRDAYDEEEVDSPLLFSSLVGTWNVIVPTPDGDFYALQTFSVDGTFTETSSLLGTLPEGPAHGVWEHRRRGGVLTFELFAFDGDGAVVGRIRVRNLIRFVGSNNFTAISAVDFIELDGTVISDIGGGEYAASRMQIRGL